MTTESKNAWLQARRRGIGGSDIGAICGLSPYATALEVWQDKLGIAEPKKETFAMKRGNLLESLVADEFKEVTGFEVIEPASPIFHHAETPYFAASIDRFFETKTGERFILECKTVNGRNTEKFTGEFLPLHYYAQLQWYLGVTGLAKGVLAWVNTYSDTFDWREFEAEPDFIGFLQGEATAFWKNHVETKLPPAPRSLDDLKFLYPEPVKLKTLEMAEANASIIYDFRQTCSELQPLQQKADALKLQIQLLMRDAEILTIGGETVATFKADKNGKRTFKLK